MAVAIDCSQWVASIDEPSALMKAGTAIWEFKRLQSDLNCTLVSTLSFAQEELQPIPHCFSCHFVPKRVSFVRGEVQDHEAIGK
eukprot:scaffold207385_cov14-Tisochrysis_lutea.AAC.1